MMLSLEAQGPDAESAQALAGNLVDTALARGLLLNYAGGAVVTLSPPLVIGEDEMEGALAILEHTGNAKMT